MFPFVLLSLLKQTSFVPLGLNLHSLPPVSSAGVNLQNTYLYLYGEVLLRCAHGHVQSILPLLLTVFKSHGMFILKDMAPEK